MSANSINGCIYESGTDCEGVYAPDHAKLDRCAPLMIGVRRMDTWRMNDVAGALPGLGPGGGRHVEAVGAARASAPLRGGRVRGGAAGRQLGRGAAQHGVHGLLGAGQLGRAALRRMALVVVVMVLVVSLLDRLIVALVVR